MFGKARGGVALAVVSAISLSLLAVLMLMVSERMSSQVKCHQEDVFVVHEFITFIQRSNKRGE